MPVFRIRTATVADEPAAIVEGTSTYDANDASSDALPATSIVKESEAASPSVSVAVYVYPVASCLFVGVPARSAGAYFSRAQVDACMADDAPVIQFPAPAAWDDTPEPVRRVEMAVWITGHLDPLLERLDLERRHVFGFDFARRIALSVVAPIEIGGRNALRCPFLLELHRVPHAQQFQVLDHIAGRLPRFGGAAMDATGAGSAVAEAMADKWGSLIEEVSITQPWWAEWMSKYKARVDDGEIVIPRSADVLSDHRAVQLVNGTPKLPAGQTARGGRHGDSVVALALGCQAAGQAVGPPTADSAGGRVSTGEDWRRSFITGGQRGAADGLAGWVS